MTHITLTREQAEQIEDVLAIVLETNFGRDIGLPDMTHDEAIQRAMKAHAFAITALSAPQQEPEKWEARVKMLHGKSGPWFACDGPESVNEHFEVRPLYTHPAPDRVREAAQAVVTAWFEYRGIWNYMDALRKALEESR